MTAEMKRNTGLHCQACGAAAGQPCTVDCPEAGLAIAAGTTIEMLAALDLARMPLAVSAALGVLRSALKAAQQSDTNAAPAPDPGAMLTQPPAPRTWEARFAQFGGPSKEKAMEGEIADWRASHAASVAVTPDPTEEMLDMLGRIHPFAMPREDDRKPKAYERLRRAFVIQQPWPVPDQAAIVWRADLMNMSNDLTHKQAFFDHHRAKPSAHLASQAAPVELTDEQIHKIALKHAFLAYERIERRQAQEMLIGFARAILRGGAA